VDVIEDSGGRSLYLDGVPFYRQGDLHAFNEFMAEVPGALHPSRGLALVIGSGSFSSAARLHRLGYQVTVVELDAVVAELGMRHFKAEHQLSPQDISLEIDDGRRFLARQTTRYDVIVLDVPAPYRVQTALLHTPAFYRQVAAHLQPDGVAALALCDGVEGPLGRRIAASALLAFPEVLVIESESVGLGILYGGHRLPFSAKEVASALALRDPQGGRVLQHRTVQMATLLSPPLSEKDLLGVLLLAHMAYSPP
jgi:hypothetical protein